MTATRPTVYSIPAGEPFVDRLAAGLIERYGADPLTLSRVTVLLPTRRACRSLREAFLRVSGGKALLLPAMLPLGDLGEEDGTTVAPPPGLSGAAAEGARLPPAIADLNRLFLLAQLIRARPDAPARLDHALRLAEELASFLDQVQTERIDMANLSGLVPEDYAGHWQLTLRFLTIVTEQWPVILQELGAMDPAARRNAVLEAVSRAWKSAPPATPVFAAGSTGSIPATADLLSTVARLPHGAVVLPGLDRDLDDGTWSVLDPVHPQFGLRQLLAHMRVGRDEVAPWQGRDDQTARRTLVRFAMRPADAESDHTVPEFDAGKAVEGLTVASMPGPREESLVIALAMRRTLDEPGRTAALVTTDRNLARQVTAQLRRWHVDVDDSAGVPLDRTVPGAFLRLTAEMVAADFAPVPFLAACKHPLASGGLSPGRFKHLVRSIELLAMRGPRPAPGWDGLRSILTDEPATPPGTNAYLDRMAEASAPFEAALLKKDTNVADIVRTHIAFAEWLAASDVESGAQRLWSGEAGEDAARILNDLIERGALLGPMNGSEYPAFLSALLARSVVRARYGLHPRLNIWGPLEARLQQADLMIVGGLNEGTWPADPGADPWMSRPMRRDFGLPDQDRRIGLAAHDFQQIVCAGNVLLTRSTKVDGAPTVPSRWLVRLETALKTAGRRLPEDEGARLLAIAEALDAPSDGVIQPVAAPEPRPPVDARPRRLSVTQIETWVRDPYAIYARHILKLKAMDPIDAPPDAAGRGTAIHEALDLFVRAYPDELPEDAVTELEEFGRQAFGAMLDRPGIAAFWWPRFQRIARWFVEQERARRRSVQTLATEVSGSLVLDTKPRAFELKAKADRIDRLPAGGLSIIDYKTGAAPSKSDLETGYAPQLPLEAAMAAAGAFTGVDAGDVGSLSVWRLRGIRPAGEITDFKIDITAVAESAREGLHFLIELFNDPTTPYFARPKPEVAPRYSDYEHLARLKEWSLSPGGGSP